MSPDRDRAPERLGSEPINLIDLLDYVTLTDIERRVLPPNITQVDLGEWGDQFRYRLEQETTRKIVTPGDGKEIEVPDNQKRFLGYISYINTKHITERVGPYLGTPDGVDIQPYTNKRVSDSAWPIAPPIERRNRFVTMKIYLSPWDQIEDFERYEDLFKPDTPWTIPQTAVMTMTPKNMRLIFRGEDSARIVLPSAAFRDLREERDLAIGRLKKLRAEGASEEKLQFTERFEGIVMARSAIHKLGLKLFTRPTERTDDEINNNSDVMELRSSS